MKAAEIRRRFIDYFKLHGHAAPPSSSLVPGDDPTLLFTNAGMVQFKEVFLGSDKLPYNRAVTSQKCVRAGGKHNDLEQVGITARHHTFFEMLGNFSFGDYFKKEAIGFAWEFLTKEIGLDPNRIFVTVHYTDDEAYALWQEVAGVPAERIFRLGDKDNFWQMADTGPCGPCSELHFDLRSEEERMRLPTQEEFEVLGEAGRFLEIWNLVFMQYDRDASGVLNPLPAPSIDTGAGLERVAAVLQGADSNYHTDLFLPLLDRVAKTVGRPYAAGEPEGVSYRVLADHARAVAFLLADGVYPANDGRGYVLRRILRRGVRHAWLLGMRQPVLVEVVDEVTRVMGDIYPELLARKEEILKMTRLEEERFLATIEGGMDRFDAIAPVHAPAIAGQVRAKAGIAEVRVGTPPPPASIPGDEVFRLYDTFGFPLDLTQVMAAERGYAIDEEGFERALEEQRSRSRADRKGAGIGMEREGGEVWRWLDKDAQQNWVGWEGRKAETEIVGACDLEGGIVGVIPRDSSFYLAAGGQVSDTGTVEGEGWRLTVHELRKIEGRTVLIGELSGELPAKGPVPATLQVDERSRHDTERNHTATHLLHAALRKVLGTHVAQRGSLVAPDRLRFDFSHTAPMTAEEIERVQQEVNEAIWADHPVQWAITTKEAAVARGAMALFGEKYGDEVRVVEIPGVSLELCGGTHLRHTGEAGSFLITSESGVASGVRRIEALTGKGAFDRLRQAEEELDALATKLRTVRDNLPKRVDDLLKERGELEGLLDELRRTGGAAQTAPLVDATVSLPSGGEARYRGIRMRVRDSDDARAFGDAFRESESMSVAVVAAESGDGRPALYVFVTDDLVGKGVRAGNLIRDITAVVGGKGGGKPHMAQGGIEDASRVEEALRVGETVLRQAIEGGGA